MTDNTPDNYSTDTTGSRLFTISRPSSTDTVTIMRWSWAGDNTCNYVNPSSYEATRTYYGFEFQHGWGFKKAKNDGEYPSQVRAERRQSQQRHLRGYYLTPIPFRLQRFLKPRIVYQPCWRSGRWKSLT